MPTQVAAPGSLLSTVLDIVSTIGVILIILSCQLLSKAISVRLFLSEPSTSADEEDEAGSESLVPSRVRRVRIVTPLLCGLYCAVINFFVIRPNFFASDKTRNWWPNMILFYTASYVTARAALQPMINASPYNFGRSVQSCCYVLVFLPLFTLGMRMLEHGFVLQAMDALVFVLQPAVATLCFAWAAHLLEKAAGRSGRWRWSRS